MSELNPSSTYIEFEGSEEGITTLRLLAGDKCNEDTKEFAIAVMAELAAIAIEEEAVVDKGALH